MGVSLLVMVCASVIIIVPFFAVLDAVQQLFLYFDDSYDPLKDDCDDKFDDN